MKSWLSIIVAVPLALAGCQERDVGERPTAQPVDPITQGEYSQTYESEREDDPLAQSRYGEPMDWQAEREGEELDDQRATGATAFDEQTGQETAQPNLNETGTGDQLSATEQPAASAANDDSEGLNQPVAEDQNQQLGQEEDENEEATGEQALNETPSQPVELVYEEPTIITPEGAFDQGEQPDFAAETEEVEESEETPPGTQALQGQKLQQDQKLQHGQQAQAGDSAKVAQLEQRIAQLETQLQELKTQKAEQKPDQQLQSRVDQLETKVNTLAQGGQGTHSQQSIAVMTAKVLEDIARELRSGERFQAEREETGTLNQEQTKPVEQKGYERRPTDDLDQSPEEPRLDDELMPADPSMDKPHDLETDY